MRLMITALAMVAILIIGGAEMAVQAQSGFESEPVLKASELATPELLKGPRFSVDERVPVKGFLERFTIRSDFGTFDAHGIHMLQIRVKEVQALGQLDDMSKTKEFAEAAGKAVIRPVTSAAHMLMNPVTTVEGLPDGVFRLFDRVKLGSEKVVQAATAPTESGGERAGLVAKRVGGITVTALGYEKERRELAKSVGVDPYTTNPVLAKKLDDMAWVAFSGRFLIQTATSVLVPGSMVLSAVTITNSTVYDTSAGDLVNNAQGIFAATGAGDAQVKALMSNPHYSLSVLTAVAMGLQRLQGVGGLASVVNFAGTAGNEDEARFVASAVNMLARYHESVSPLAQVTAPRPIIGHATSGELVIAAPVDYVAWTERAASFAQRSDLKAPRRVAWLSGRMSPMARKEFTTRGWTAYESFTIAAER